MNEGGGVFNKNMSHKTSKTGKNVVNRNWNVKNRSFGGDNIASYLNSNETMWLHLVK